MLDQRQPVQDQRLLDSPHPALEEISAQGSMPLHAHSGPKKKALRSYDTYTGLELHSFVADCLNKYVMACADSQSMFDGIFVLVLCSFKLLAVRHTGGRAEGKGQRPKGKRYCGDSGSISCGGGHHCSDIPGVGATCQWPCHDAVLEQLPAVSAVSDSPCRAKLEKG